MSNFLSGRQTELKVGISSFTENKTVLSVIGNTNIIGILTASSFSGNATSATYSSVAGVSTYATTTGISTYSTSSGISTYSEVAGISTYSTSSGISTYSEVAGVSTYSEVTGISTFATTAGVSTYATSSGISTYSSVAGVSTYATTAGVATALQNARDFQITGDIIASAVSFDGTGNVSLAATIQPNSVSLGSDTTGDYVQSISGTTNQITVTSGTGEGSTPTLSIPNEFIAPQDVTITRDLQVNRNINTSGIVTATGGFNLGISSAGINVTSGPITGLNFIGAGNTFAVNGTIVDISIAGGGGGVSISTTPPVNPNEGDLWYSSEFGRTFIYYVDEDSSQWVDAAPFNPVEPPSTPGKTSGTFTATEGQTTFNYSYKPGYIDVFLNGIRLNSGEFVGSNGSSIILAEPASSGDILDVVEYTMGIGATGIQGPQGPLSNVAQINSSDTHYPLVVSGLGSVTAFITTTSNYFSIIPSSGTLNTNQLIVSGVCTATDFNSSSDLNLKTNIRSIENPLEKVMQLNGVKFDWKESQESSIGVIAQELEEVFPELVKQSDEYKTVNYNGLIGVLIEGMKKQQQEINILKEEIRLLREK